MEETKLKKIIDQHREMENFFSGGLVVKSTAEYSATGNRGNSFTKSNRRSLKKSQKKFANAASANWARFARTLYREREVTQRK